MAGWLESVARWFRRRRTFKEARRLLAAAFRDPQILRGTSLQPRHASRWVLLDADAEEGSVVRIRFGILRHPRPYPYSRQCHKVLEHYLYDVKAGRIERLGGLNLTRARGEDADD